MGESVDFSEMTIIAAEGARVGFVICDRCHAAILIDPRDEGEGRDRRDQHARWHFLEDQG